MQPPTKKEHRCPTPAQATTVPLTISASTSLHGSTIITNRRIGNANRDSSKINNTPGPGEYNLSGSKSGPKITMSSKPKVNSLGEVLAPGPGNYNVSSNGVYKNPSAFTMGAKYGSKV